MGTSHVKALCYLIRTEGHIFDVPNREHTTVAMATGVSHSVTHLHKGTALVLSSSLA
jgi:hypothetical protein